MMLVLDQIALGLEFHQLFMNPNCNLLDRITLHFPARPCQYRSLLIMPGWFNKIGIITAEHCPRVSTWYHSTFMSFCICILQVIKHWRWERPGNEATVLLWLCIWEWWSISGSVPIPIPTVLLCLCIWEWWST